MSSSSPELYPVVVRQDRYGGCYSGGAWLAIANADDPVGDRGMSRIQWAMGDDGPSGCDITAGRFWIKPPSWIKAGTTPECAIAALEEGARPGGQTMLLRGA